MNLPPYKQYPQTESSDILLREIRSNEVGKIIAISFYNGVKALSSVNTSNMLEKINLDYQSGESIHWGIIDKKTNQIVGTCGYYRGFENGSGELGCILIDQFQGKGFMTKALRLATDFGFESMKLKKVWAATSSENIRAQKLLARVGFQKIDEIDSEITFEITI